MGKGLEKQGEAGAGPAPSRGVRIGTVAEAALVGGACAVIAAVCSSVAAPPPARGDPPAASSSGGGSRVPAAALAPSPRAGRAVAAELEPAP